MSVLGCEREARATRAVGDRLVESALFQPHHRCSSPYLSFCLLSVVCCLLSVCLSDVVTPVFTIQYARYSLCLPKVLIQIGFYRTEPVPNKFCILLSASAGLRLIASRRRATRVVGERFVASALFLQPQSPLLLPLIVLMSFILSFCLSQPYLR